MTGIRRLILDVLKPKNPTITELAEKICEVDGIEGVNASLVEIDEEVENVKLTIEGEEIDDSQVVEEIEDLGGSVHSVDEIVCGSKMVEKVDTPQDK